MGKKTVEDSRRFEKDRRDKLNVAFEELGKLLPDHDPSVTLSKIEILRKAAQYIKQLQDQNDEIMKFGSDSALSSELEKLRKRVTHLLLKTKELVDALRSAGVPIPTNKKKRKRKVVQSNPANQNVRGAEKETDVQSLNEEGQRLRKVKCSCLKISPERKPLKESNPVASTVQPPSTVNTPAITSGHSILNSSSVIAISPPVISAPIMATSIQAIPIIPNSSLSSSPITIPKKKIAHQKKKVPQKNSVNQNETDPEKETDVESLNEECRTVRRVKCGCTKTSPERKPLKESNPVATTQCPSSVSTAVSTSGHSILNNSNIIAVSPSLISTPIMATRIQSIPVVPNSATSSSVNTNPAIIPSHIVPSLSTAVLEGCALGNNRTTLTNKTGPLMATKISTPVTLTSNFVKEIIVPSLNKKTINVVTTTSSNIITTQSIVNSGQLISLPQSNPIVAPRIQNVPVIEKNILSNLGPGTLILADGRIMNVPPMVPQIVVKPQPAVILMPTTKKKEKLLIPKRREVTKTTFSNKAPIPAIQTFRLESCRRVRPKKKPKSIKPLQKTKIGGSKETEQNKKRKLEEGSQNELMERTSVSEKTLSKELVPSPTSEQFDEATCKNSDDKIDESSLVKSVNRSVSSNDCSSAAAQVSSNTNLPIPSAIISCINEISISKSVESCISIASTSVAENSHCNTSLEVVNTIEQSVSNHSGQSLSLDSARNIPGNENLYHVSNELKSNQSLPGSSFTSSVSSDKNLKGEVLCGESNTLNSVLLPESISVDNRSAEINSDSVLDIQTNSSPKSDFSSNCVKTTKSVTSSNDILANIPPCISSSTEQDSIFVSKDKQVPSTETTRSTLSEGSVVKQICSDVERSVNGSNKKLIEKEMLNSDLVENLDVPSSSQPSTSSGSKNFNESNCITDNPKLPEEKSTVEHPINASQTINFINSNDLTSLNDDSRVKGNSDNIKPDSANQDAHLNSQSSGSNEELNHHVMTYPQCGPNPCQRDMSTNNVSTPQPFINSGKTGSISQTMSQGKSFSHRGNPPCELSPNTPLNSSAYPNISNNIAVPHTLNNPQIVTVANSQVSLTSHSSYGISGIHSEKEFPFFNSNHSKPTGFNSNEKASTNCNSTRERLSNNIFPIYNSSTNGTVSNSHSSFNLKPSENAGNAVEPMTVGRNADICTGFNQSLPIETTGEKPLYSRHVSFPQNSLSKSSNWDKSQYNKSIYGTAYIDAPEETNPKTAPALHRSKMSSFEKQSEHAQLSYLGFQNEQAVTSQNNTFFNNVLPSSCGFNETPGVFSYHNTSTSVVSSYSFIPHENISSLHKSSGGMKSIHQDRVYFPEITSSEKSKGNSFRSNEKLSVGNISLYPSASQALISSVYPNSTQTSLATVYSTFPQPNLSNVYSSSSQLNASAYPNFSQQNLSTYPNSNPNKGVGVYTSSTHPVISCVYNFSQPNASGVYTTSSLSNTFIKATQSASSVSYSAPAQNSISNVKNSNSHSYLNSSQHNSSIAYTNPPQANVSSASFSSTQASAYISYASSAQPAYSTSVLHSSSNVSGIHPRNYPTATQTLLGVFPNTGASDISKVYSAAPCADNLVANTSSFLPPSSNSFSTSTHVTGTSTINRTVMCNGIVNESPLYHSDVVSKPKQASENNGSISLSNYKSNSSNAVSTNTDNILPISSSSKPSDIVLANNPATLNEMNKAKESSNLPTTIPDPNLSNRRQNNKAMETPYLHDKDASRSKYTPTTNVASLEQRPKDSERSVVIVTEKDTSSQISNTSKSAEHTEKNRVSELHKYNNYDFVSNKGTDNQNKTSEGNASLGNNNESVDKSIQSNLKNFTTCPNGEEKHLDTESNKLLSNSNKKSVSTEVIESDINFNYNSQHSNNYSKPIQTSTSSFNGNQPISSALSKSYSNFNSSNCETINNHFDTPSNPRSVVACSTLQTPQSNQPLPIGNAGPPTELLTKGGMIDVTHRAPEKQDKSIQKSYEPGGSNSHMKGDIPSDFLKSKDIERNTFIPIIDDVRLPTDFSSDLFSSLQVPTGGAHSESISPTAAFLLAFPLVSTSRNVENLHDNENHENQTSTPTTILQIGNIEPPSTELFHPIDFQKSNSKPSDHFDINNDYLNVNELNEKQNQNPYKRCEKRKENFPEYNKEVRPTDPKQKSKSTVVTTSTYTQSFSHPLLSCTEFQYCEKDSSQWQQEFPATITKEQKKNCDRKKEKAVQKGCFHQTYPECYSYKDKKRKQQSRISVNWMTTPENREQTDYQNKEPELVSSAPAQSLYAGISLDFPTEPFPDFCNSKKTNNYAWSPNKALLPALDNHLMIPSTLPTLVGDLALGTSTPSESYKTYDMPKSQGQMSKKTTEKLDVNKKQSDFPKNQANFFSVSQLVDPKSKKQKTNERNYKRPDKNSKQRNSFNCPKRKDDHCMYYEERNSFMPNQNQYNEKRHTYKGNYSAESLIGAQHNEIDFSSSFNYQQNTNYFQSEFPPTVDSSGQQYGYFQQSHFTGFSHDECQEFGFNTSQRGLENNRQKSSGRKDDNYQGSGLLQPQICPPYTKAINYLPSSHINTNTTTTLTNFNLSTIFPEMNDQRVGSAVQPSQQMSSSYSNSQNYRSHIS